MSRISTSHVGSFPLDYSEESEVRIFNDMVNLGIDYPPVPQLRNFIEIFLDPLVEQGFLRKEKGLYIVVREAKGEAEALEIPEYKIISSLTPKVKDKVKGVKACITGPFTLASYIFLGEVVTADIMNSVLRDKNYVLSFLVPYVAKVANSLAKLGYDYINIDEPVLSVMVGARRILFNYTREEIVNALDTIFEKIGYIKIRGIHVCARLPKLLKPILLSTEYINLLDHEHYDTRENLKFYTYEDLESSDKHIAVGVLSSKKPKVEDIKEVKEMIITGWNLYRDRLLIVKPDCGFKGLKGSLGDEAKEYELSLMKLKVLVEAVEQVNSEL